MNAVAEIEKKALTVLAESFAELGTEYYLHVRTVADRSGLPMAYATVVMRSLRDQGFAIFRRGLMTDEGEPAGAGYAITDSGLAAVSLTSSEISYDARGKLVESVENFTPPARHKSLFLKCELAPAVGIEPTTN